MKTKKYKTLQELFRSKKRWTKGWLAKTDKGKDTNVYADDAVSWCLVGGIQKVYGSGERYNEIRAKIQRALPNWASGPICFNDDESTKLSDIKRLVKRAGV